jgi:eukaryotic-like serine/threonine-protein kinase
VSRRRRERASALSHPKIVTIYEVGRAEGTSFIAMELVEGRTLRGLLSSGPMPVKKLLSIAVRRPDRNLMRILRKTWKRQGGVAV